MDNRERQTNQPLPLTSDSMINVVVNTPAEDENVIDLVRVFHNMKLKKRFYAWLLVLCMLVGVCAPLLMYQLNHSMLTVSSVVTLDYEVPTDAIDPKTHQVKIDPKTNEPEIAFVPVTDLTAPDGEELDLNQITSAYVLQNALNGVTWSQPITVANLRGNIKVEKILTEDSRRQQEVASAMMADKNAGAYQTVQEIELKYENRAVVTLTNGFGDADSKTKLELRDDEVHTLLDRVLASYNDYLALTYADLKLPDDKLSVIDLERLDILESLDLLRTALTDLYDYCDEKSDAVKAYRSGKTGRSLKDLMQMLQLARTINVDYLYSYAYTNSLVKDKAAMITNYQFQLRTLETKLDVVNENIDTTRAILETYKNDEIYVSMQESDAARSTKTTTDYYNELILQQATNYGEAAKLKQQIADLQQKIASLQDQKTDQSLETVEGELENAYHVCKNLYQLVCDHMTELTGSPFASTFARHSAAYGKTQGFLASSAKNMIIGAVVGAVIACVFWFFGGLAPEFNRKKEDEVPGKEARRG